MLHAIKNVMTSKPQCRAQQASKATSKSSKVTHGGEAHESMQQAQGRNQTIKSGGAKTKATQGFNTFNLFFT
jgi:hypothetical protein